MWHPIDVLLLRLLLAAQASPIKFGDMIWNNKNKSLQFEGAANTK